MKTSSAKAKGRALQQWVRDKLLEMFPILTEDDIRSTSMGAGGEDIQLSSQARALFPYNIECKNQQRFKGIYDTYAQAGSHGKHEPLVIIKSNHKKPLVIMAAEHFLDLIQRGRNA